MLRRSLLVVPFALAMAACSSTTESTPSTSATTIATTTTTAATGTPSTTGAATTSAPPASTTSTTSTASTTAGGPAAVTAYFESIGLAVTPEEATCLAGTFDASTLAALADAVATGAEANEAAQVAVFGGIVSCEPQSYADAQIGAIVSLGSTSEADAACIVEANNELLRADPAVLALAAGLAPPSDWPAAEKAKLRATLTSCVPGEVADRIIAGG